MQFATTAIWRVDESVDTLMVAGGRDMDEASADPELLREVRRPAAEPRRVTSVCSGAFLLAAAGLLDGRRATTHWAECGLLHSSYPNVTLEPDAIYVRDGNIWTSAGVTAGIDLALALVADDHGRQAAAAVARQLVVYLRRTGGQAQFSALLAAQAADSEPVRDLLSWLPDHLLNDLSVPALARQVNLSERQFSRVFKAEVGTSRADHVETARLEGACRLLETTHSSSNTSPRSAAATPDLDLNQVQRHRGGDHPRRCDAGAHAAVRGLAPRRTRCARHSIPVATYRCGRRAAHVTPLVLAGGAVGGRLVTLAARRIGAG